MEIGKHKIELNEPPETGEYYKTVRLYGATKNTIIQKLVGGKRNLYWVMLKNRNGKHCQQRSSGVFPESPANITPQNKSGLLRHGWIVWQKYTNILWRPELISTWNRSKYRFACLKEQHAFYQRWNTKIPKIYRQILCLNTIYNILTSICTKDI